MDSAPQQGASPGSQSFSLPNVIERLSPRHWATYVTEAPRATRAIAITMAAFYLGHLLFGNSLNQMLGLVPGYTLGRLFIWNVITSGFYHTSIIDLVFSVATLLAVGKSLEPFWGTREFVSFIVLVNFFAGIGCLTYNLVLFTIYGQYQLLFPRVAYGGFGGVVSGFAVVGKQLIPDYESTIFAVVPVRVKHLPLVLLFSNALWHLLGFPISSYSFIFTGTLTAWIYLRYYQRRTVLPADATADATTSGGDSNQTTETTPSSAPSGPAPPHVVIGDRSDSMAFISFFPEAMHPALNTVCCGLGRISPPDTLPLFLSNRPTSILAPTASPSPSSSSTNHSVNTPTAIPQPDLETQRRRLLALQQVDARLAKMKASKAATAASPSSM